MGFMISAWIRLIEPCLAGQEAFPVARLPIYCSATILGARMGCSIVIRAHNEAMHFGRFLEGISQQTEVDVEIILVDSGLVKGYGKKWLIFACSGWIKLPSSIL